MILWSTIFISLYAACSSLSVDVMHPIKQGGIEAAVLIAPGASIKGSSYVPLAQMLQNASSLKLWVVLMDNFLIGAVNPAQLPQAINMAIKSLRTAGFKSDNIFLAGHSLGGAMTAMHASSDSKLKGAILFAAYLTNGNHLKDYPIPVLTLSGDLDGLTRITRIVSSFEDLEDSIQKDPNSLYRTPVIVMSGVNHAQFATGDMPSNVKQHDLPADSTEGEAHVAIAKYTSAFLNSVVTGVDQNLVRESKHVLGTGYNSTKKMLQPLLTVKAMDQNKEGVSHWTIKAQQMIINAQNPSLNIHITNSERNFAALEFAHPSSTFKNNDVSISTYTAVSLPFNPLDVTTGPQSPSQLQAKMKSQDAVKSKAQNSVFRAPATCRDINKAAFNYAMSMSSTDAVRRFRASGRHLSFLDDRPTSNGPQWLMENLVLNYNSTGLTVQSPTLKTDLHVLFSSFAGQTYCKLLSPYRAMEYIYIDSMAPVS